MKALLLLAVLASTTSAYAITPAHTIALPTQLFGEWRENCIRVLELNASEPTAPFVQFKMVLGWDGTMEHNYSYYSDDKCTKRKSQKREYAKYKVLESNGHKAKLLVRKDLGDGVISESIVQLTLPKANGMEVKTLSTKIELDDLLSENPLAGVDKNAGSGEDVKKLTRQGEAPKTNTKKI
jgi:hypothetical protein